MSGTLFRTEVRAHAENSWLGRIVLIRPPSFTFLTACALAMMAGLASFFVLGQYTSKARVTGMIAPVRGVVKVLAQQPGVVEGIFVAEGDAVTRETSLLVLGDARSSRTHGEIGAAVGVRLIEREKALDHEREYVAQAMRADQAALEHRRGGISRELEQIGNEIAAQEARSGIAQQGLGRARRLEGIGFLSPAALDRERDAALDQESRVEALRRARLTLEREQSSLRYELASAASKANAQLASIDMQHAAIEQERLEHEVQYRSSIVAPTDGVVTTVLVERGQMVVPGTPLATIIPANSPLEAQLFAPSRSIGFVRAGNEVLLRYLAFPHQKFGSYKARVVSVSRNPLSAGELGFAPADGGREPLYRIKVALDSQSVSAYGRNEPLQAGMQVEADILLDRRRLIEWIFEPMLSLAGRT
jgi:membrane fusion protein